MPPSRKRTAVTEYNSQAQEVLRANRELAAYFKGRRTEREARSALKIIKAFVKARERMPVERRPPLPAAANLSRTGKPPAHARPRRRAPVRRKRSPVVVGEVRASSSGAPFNTREPGEPQHDT